MKTKRFTFLNRILLTGIFMFAFISFMRAQVIHFENFDGESNGGTSCTSSQTLSSTMWSNVTGDDGDWTIDAAGTGSSLTGPNHDNTTGGATGKYLYTEASSCYNKTENLVSNTLDLSSYSAFYLDFYYHRYGSGMGPLYVDVSTDGGTNWTNSVWSITGQQHTSYAAAFSLASVNLSAYTGTGMTTVKIRIRGVTGSNYYSDMAIDDITLWAPVANDAGISAITAPTGSLSPGASDIKVTLANIGSATLTSATIKYTVNGGTVSSYSWGGSIASGSSLSNINLGSHTFVNGVANIKAWAESPNGNTDGDNSNDTAYSTVYVCSPLSGIYTIGGSSPNYADFATAAAAVENCGISGPVVFNIASGTYTEQVTIGSVPGASATNTIIFQSAAGDSTAVILQYAATGTNDNWTVRLDGADYITFTDLTIKATGSSYGRVVEFINGADNNTISNCIIDMPTTTSSNFAGIYSYSTINEHNSIINNIINNGYYGIYYYGLGSTSLQSGNIITNNIINGYYYYGIYTRYQDAININSNIVSNGSSSSYAYGIYLYYCDNAFKVKKNNVSISGTSSQYALYLNYCDGSTSAKGLVANNFISVTGTGTNSKYGIYSNYGNNNDYFYNSVNITGGTNTGYAFRLYGYSGNTMKNNNIVNNSGGYAFYGYSSYPIDADYNNYYTSGSNLGYWGGAKTDLAALQSATGQDANSISVNPTFTSATDLHTGDFVLNAKGTSLTEVTDDIDGETRTATPDIGADEFTPVGKDAAISLVSPVPPTAAGNKTVKVEIANAMTVAISSINLTYTDGTTPVTQNFTGLNIAQAGSDTLSFTTPFVLSGATQLRVYINSVNGSGDLVQGNDTTTWQALVPALSGVYTINNTVATGGTNFNSFGDAVTALQNGGTDGAVTFNVASGTYTEQVTIDEIIGASASSPIVFQSASGDSTNVILKFGATSSTANWTVRLNGADYITFQNMTLQATGTSYGRVVEVINGAEHNSFKNNIIQMPTTTSSNFCGVYDYNTLNHYNTYKNNIISGGYYGMYMYGSGTTAWEIGTIIDGNEISGFYYYGVYSIYQDGIQVTNNYVHSPTYGYSGLYIYYAFNGFNVSNNRIIMDGTYTSTYALRIYYCNYYAYAGSSSAGLVSNNFVTVQSTSSGYGLYAYYSDNVKYYHNSINMSTGTSGYALYQGNTASNTIGQTFKNNIFVNTAGGYAAYYTYPTTVAASDYNDYYATGTNLTYWNGANSSLSAHQTASSMDANSVSIDPNWFSATDLHTKSLAFNNLGTPITGITTDIDGETRDATNPDIGADEFTPPANDISVTSIDALNTVSGNQSIKINFDTYGTTTLTTAQFNYSVNGTVGTAYNWSGNLTNGQSATSVNIGSFNFLPGQNTVKAWPVNVNGNTDEDNANDTATYTFTITVDAGIIAMDEASIQYGSSPVNAFIANYGTDILTSSAVNWSVNGVIQTPASWTGSITSGNADGPVSLGNYTFGAGTYELKIWTSSPNSATDIDATNDTLTKSFSFAVDAGISQIDPPGVPGTQNVVVYMKNFGTIPLTTATIYYKVNSGSSLTYNWTGNLAPGAVDGPITVGTETFSYGSQSIESWTFSPNGGTDANTANDNKTENFNITADIGIIGGNVFPQDNCGRSNDTLSLEIQNFGTGPVSGPFSISYTINGGTAVMETVPASVTIQPGSTYTYTFSSLLNLAVTTADATFALKGWTTLATDANNTNDTAGGNVESWYTPTAPTTTGATVAYGNTATLGATLINGDSLNWYDTPMGNNIINYGASYTTPALFDTTSYYVAAQSYGMTLQDQTFTKSNGTSSYYQVPCNAYYDYSWSRFIYQPSDLNLPTSGPISKIAFQLGNSVSNYTVLNQKIYVMHTTASTITSSAYDNPVAAGATLIYDGSITYNGVSGDWQEIQLQTTFTYNNSDNLLFFYENRDGSWASGYPYFKYYSTTNRAVYKYQDGSFPTTTGYISSYLPNIQLTVNVPTPTPFCESSRTPVTAIVTGIPSDAGISAIETVTETGSQNVNVTLKNFTSVILDSVRINYIVNGTPGSTYYWTGNLGNNGTANITLGSETFAYGSNTIKAWTSYPNGSTDPNANNDTMTINFNIYSDLGVIAVNEPIAGCGLGNETVIVDIKNFGTDTVHSYAANFQLVGSSNVVSENITTAIAPGDTYTHTFTSFANLAVTSDSVFKIKAYTTLTNDNDANNDTTVYSILSSATPTAPIIENDTINYGTSATLVANSNFLLYWFDDPYAGNQVATGDTFFTPNLFDTTTYYVEARSGQADLKITEITQWHGGGTGFTSPAPSWLVGDDFAEITNLGTSPADLTGYVYHREGTGAFTYALPSIILNSGEVLTLATYGGSTDDPTNNYYVAANLSAGSSSPSGNWLTDPAGNVVDAVALNSYTFSGGSGVTSSDWSGNIASSSGNAGVVRTVSDNNTASDWSISSVVQQTLGAVNNGLAPQGMTCVGPRAAVTAIVQNFPALDAGVLKVNGPISGPGKSNAEILNITVKNFGTLTIDTLSIAYTLDGATAVIDTVFATLNPGDTANFSFATTMDLSTLATYNVSVYSTLVGDVVTNNDAVNVQIIHSDYCISQANSTADDDIGNVTIKHPVTNADLLNKGIASPVLSNPLSNKLYSNFSSLTPTILQQGQSYPTLISQITSGGTFYATTTKVYIDFNQDGILDANTELVFTGNTTGGDPSSNLMTGNINIPANATLGNTRMRVVMDETGPANPCGAYGYGETEDYTVTIVPQVWANAGSNDTICNTFSSTLTGTGTGPTYAWSSGSGTSTTVSPTATTMYYFSVTDTYGFTAVDSAEVFVRDLPTVNFPTLADICVDASALTLNMATPSGGNYYGNGVGTGTFTPSTATVGTHTLKYIYTDIYGCTDSTTQNITVNALPVITLGSTTDKCYDAPQFALNFATSPTGGTYIGAGVDGSGNFTAATAGSGTHYIKYEFTDANGCYNIDSTTQKVNALPVPTAIATPDTIFYGTNTTLDVSVVAGSFNAPANAPLQNATYSYLWSPADSLGNASNATSQSPTTKNLFLPTLFDVTVTDNSTSCTNTDQVTVYIKGGPLSTTPIATLDTVCSGAQSQLKAQASGGSESYTYSWTSNPSGFTNALANPFVSPTVTTMYYVTIDDGFNTATDSIEIYAHALPTGTPVNSTAAICLYDSTQLSLNFTGQSPWTIYVSDGTGSNTIPGVTDPWNMYVNPSTTTTYHLDSLIDGNGCFNTSTSQVAVTVWDLPTVSASGSDTMCYGDSIQFTLNFTGATPWEFDVTHLSANMNQSNTETGITSPFTVWAADVESTVHSITRLKDANGCQITGNPIDSVYSYVWSLPTVAVSMDSIFHCYGDSTMISLGFTGPTPWDITIFDGTNSFTQTVNGTPWTPYVNDTTSTWYYVTSLVDDHGCVNNAIQDSIYVNVWQLPTPSFTGLAADYCIDATATTLVPTPTGGTFNGQGISGATFTPATAGVGSKSITYTYTDGNGCTNYVINNTTVNALPIPSIVGLDAAYCIDAIADTIIGIPSPPTPCVVCTIPTGYCTSANSSSVDEYINNVSINGASNPSTGTVYSNFTANLLSTLTIGQTYSMSVTVNAGNYTEYVSVYVDWNRNGSFETTEETSFGSYTVSGNHAFTQNIIVPSTAASGETMMRVVCRYNSAPNACGSYSYGETEDYKISITAPAGTGIFTGSGMSGDVFTASVAGLGSKVITYTYTDANSCTNSITDTTIINALPTLSLPTLAAVCVSEPTFAVTGATPIGGIWSGNGVTSNNFDAATAGANMHYLKYFYTDANNCSNIDSTTITVNALPIISFSGLAAAYCANDAGNSLTGIPTGGNFTGIGMTTNMFDPSVNGAGNVDITYHFTDANNCTDSTSNSTIINPVHTPDFTGLDSAYCVNYMATTLIPDSLGGTFSGAGYVSGSFDPAIAGIGTHDLTYTFTNFFGCTDSITHSALVNALTPVTITGIATAYCANSPALDTLFGLPLGGTYTGALNTNNVFDPSMAYADSINEVIYSFTDANNCTNTDTISTYVNAIPNIMLPADQVICENDSAILSTGLSGAFSYLWTNSATTDSIIIDTTGYGLGMHNFGVTVTDLTTTCVNTDSTNVSFEAFPVIPIPDTVSICGYNPVSVTAGTNVNYIYNWSTGGATASVMIDSSMTQGSYYNFTVTVTSPAGCSETKSFWLIFHPDAEVDLGADTTMCITATTTLSAYPGYDYLWSTGDTTQSIDIVGYTEGVGFHNYSVTVTRFGCTANDNANVIVNPCLGIDDYEGQLNISIYPNPNKGIFNLEVLSEDAANFDYSIMDMTGKLIETGSINSLGNTIYTRSFDLSVLPKGVYFLKIQNDDVVKIERIIIQ